jgi:hypothetical protein
MRTLEAHEIVLNGPLQLVGANFAAVARIPIYIQNATLNETFGSDRNREYFACWGFCRLFVGLVVTDLGLALFCMAGQWIDLGCWGAVLAAGGLQTLPAVARIPIYFQNTTLEDKPNRCRSFCHGCLICAVVDRVGNAVCWDVQGTGVRLRAHTRSCADGANRDCSIRNSLEPRDRNIRE